ncbi:hypothetical protein V8C44DRAFT_340930 [Trichoderma aethiopicum]
MNSPLPQSPSSTTTSPSSSLSPLLPILNAFNHRHHNQHRLAHWWPVFRILRRTIRALIDDLALLSSTSLSSSKSTSRPRRDAAASPSPPPRAIWLSRHFIPRAYIAFSQLAADNQHAPLGLLLLAILSRVHAVVTQLLDRANTTSSTASTTTKQPSLSRHRPVDASNQDKGVAISRDVLPPPTQPTERLQSLPPTTTTTTTTSGRPSLDDPHSEDASPEGVTTTPLSKTKPKEAPSKEDKKRKKKKKGKGDELSSLFGSLA